MTYGPARLTLKDGLFAEFDHEMAATRRLLERVPDRLLAWRPHEKSMSLGGLAQHVANLPSWGVFILDRTDLDLDAVPRNLPEPQSHLAVMSRFEETTATTRKLLDKTDAELVAMWSLRRGNQELFSLPRIAAFRSFVLSHMIHHRGQLSVYLRLQNVPVPAIYGPSADEG